MRMIVLLAATMLAAALHAQTEWQPEKTWVFAVGVLHYEDKKLGTWPDEGRVDALMIEELKTRGVAPERITFIKNEAATRDYCAKQLEEMLAKTAQGDTLLFYFAGHGSRDFNDKARTCSLVCYDSRPKKPASYWYITQLFDAIEDGFKGGTVIMTADCCHSGALAEEAARRKKFKYGVLTSAHASSRSTGNWTFTQTLVDLLKGSALLDANGDGKLTFKEAAAYCEHEMAFCEEQLSCNAAAGGFDVDTVFAKAGDKPAGRTGERCEAEHEGKWHKVKVLDDKDGKLFVTWIGWGKKWDGWIEPATTRKWQPKVHEGGTVVEVEFDGTWYKAKVLQTRMGMHFVHYDGFPDSDDEWVPMKRIRLPK